VSPVTLRSLHNIFGEDDEALTILSLLRRTDEDQSQEGEEHGAPARVADIEAELPLRDAVAWLYRLAGKDGRISRSVSLVRAGAAPLELVSSDDVPVQEVAERLYGLAGNNPEALTRISLVTPDDPDSGNGKDETEGLQLSDVFHRFIEAVRGLFNLAGEDGQPLTILSLLVRHGSISKRVSG
jgi:hypothetical protein